MYYARSINQFIFKYQAIFSASFNKNNEKDQRNIETENLNFNHNLTETDIDIIDVRSQLEHQFQIQENKESGWIFDKTKSMKISFHKTGELNGSSYVKITLRSNAILIIQNVDKFCFIWSISSYLHPCNNSHPTRVQTYLQYFNELNIECFDFSKGFKCSDVHRFENLKNLSVNIFELNFYQDQSKWKYNLIPIENSKNGSDRVIDILIYKNNYALIKKLNVVLGDHHKIFICRICLNSYTKENILMLHKPKCENNDITSIRTSIDSHVNWKKHFHKNPFCFRIYANFEADNKFDNSSVRIETTNIYKQNPILNGYEKVSELEDVLKSGYYESPLGYDNVDWFVDEVINLETKMNF